MHRRETALFRRTLIVVDLMMTALAFLGTFYIRQWIAEVSTTRMAARLPDFIVDLNLGLASDPDAYHLLLLGVIPGWWLALWVSNTADFRPSYGAIALRYIRAVAIGLSGLLLAFFLFKLQFVARSFVVVFGFTNVILLIAARYVVMETVAFFRHRRVDGHRVVVVGVEENAVAYARSLETQPPWNVKVLGYVSVPEETQDPSIEEYLGSVFDLESILDNNVVDEVLFASTRLESVAMANAVHACDERGVALLLPLPQSLPQQARVEIATFDMSDHRVTLLGIHRTPSSDISLALKRLLDITVSGTVLLLASPFMIATAIAVRVESRGPILFKQVRAGRNGRKFMMFKFRSMVIDAEAQKAKLMHMNEMSGPVFKIARDPRVTRVGAFIRKTSVDELPQLFNILMGDMSLVGPRPPLPSEVAQYQPWQRRRLSVKPGLTGLWQVSGRNDIDFEEWMAMDLKYIDSWSLWLDIEIILRTVPAVVLKTGAS